MHGYTSSEHFKQLEQRALRLIEWLGAQKDEAAESQVSVEHRAKEHLLIHPFEQISFGEKRQEFCNNAYPYTINT